MASQSAGGSQDHSNASTLDSQIFIPRMPLLLSRQVSQLRDALQFLPVSHLLSLLVQHLWSILVMHLLSHLARKFQKYDSLDIQAMPPQNLPPSHLGKHQLLFHRRPTLRPSKPPRKSKPDPENQTNLETFIQANNSTGPRDNPSNQLT